MVGVTKAGREGDAEHGEGCVPLFPQGELGVGGLPGDAEFSQPALSLPAR